MADTFLYRLPAGRGGAARNIEPNRTTGIEPGGNHPQLNPAATLAVFNESGSGKLVRVRRIGYTSTMSVADTVARYLRTFTLISAASNEESTLAPTPMDSNNAALPSQVRMLIRPRTLTASGTLSEYIDSGLNSDITSSGPNWAGDRVTFGAHFRGMDAATAQKQRITLREGEGVALNMTQAYTPVPFEWWVQVRNQSTGACYLYAVHGVSDSVAPWALMNGAGSGVVLEVTLLGVNVVQGGPYISGGLTDTAVGAVFYERIEAIDQGSGEAVSPIKFDSSAATPTGVAVRSGCMVQIAGTSDNAISIDSSIAGSRLVPWVTTPAAPAAQPQRWNLGAQDILAHPRDASGSSELSYVLRPGEGLALIQRPVSKIGMFGFEVAITVETAATPVYPAAGDVDFGVTYGPNANDYTGTLVQPAEADVELGVSYGAGGTEFTGTLSGGACDYPAVGDVQNGVTFGSGAYTGTFVAPAVGDVQTGVGYGAGGTEFTGTFAAPAVGDVQTGVGYGASGTEFTGTLALPAVGDVQNGVGFGASGTEFTGTFVVPAAGDVDSGVGYGAGGTEFTGTLAQPAIADVKAGVSYGAGGTEFTGTYSVTCDYPAAADVQEGVSYASGAQTGTLRVPAVGDVRSGTGYGSGPGTEFTGTLTSPATSNVLVGVGYGAGGTQYTGVVTLPAVGDVQSGVTFGASLGLTGTFAWPAVGNVRSGTGYGAGGSEFTGTLTLPAVANVLSGVSFGSGGTEFTGTYVVVAVTDVRSGVTFGPGSSLTGTVTLPTASNVRNGSSYGAGGTEFTGNIVLPSASDVRLSIGYGSNGTELTGTLDPGVGGGTTVTFIARRSR
jgi:hypothetical protein